MTECQKDCQNLLSSEVSEIPDTVGQRYLRKPEEEKALLNLSQVMQKWKDAVQNSPHITTKSEVFRIRKYRESLQCR